MADERFREGTHKTTAGVPPTGSGGRPPQDGLTRDELFDKHRPSETMMFLRWTAGLILILVCGWGLVFAVSYAGSRISLSVPLAIVAALVSFGLLWLLERGLWLSRFMGLRLSNRSSQWKETLFFWITGVIGLLFRSTDATRSMPAETRPSAENSSFREIAETVVFVVVLVLLLKTFAAEAFVIPTGSMATTLWGYQKYVDCPKCGYHFPVNCSREVEGSGDELDGTNRTATRGAICPNCHYAIDFARENINPECGTGDRVLVDKPLYDLHLADPKPGDVVVFKYPEAPQSDNTPMNYIKRLAGAGEHTYGIYYGKLYVGDPDKVPNWKDASQYPEPQLDRLPDQTWDEAVRTWKSRYKDYMKKLMHSGEYDTADLAGRLKEGKDFTIFRKPLHALLAMRRIVYDNDHPASDLPETYQRWVGDGKQTAWATANEHGFHHDSNEQAQVDWLHYRNVLRNLPGEPRPELITDLMGYNTENRQEPPQYPGENWVGDLILECDVTVDQATGELVFELSKGIDRFRAHWDLSTGQCTLLRAAGDAADGYRIDPKGESAFKPLANPVTTKLRGKGRYHIRFANVDERLVVWVDGQLPFGDGLAYREPKQRGPWSNDLQPASIGVRHAAVGIHKLQLWRDTYYTQTPGQADCPDLYKPDTSTELHEILADPTRWDALRNLSAETFYVQPDHYFCLGDNSPESSDSRYWGLVPRRLLLGRALFVYYPFRSPFHPVNRVGPIK